MWINLSKDDSLSNKKTKSGYKQAIIYINPNYVGGFEVERCLYLLESH